MNANKVYIDAIIISLQKKKALLEEVMIINKNQSDLLLDSEFDYDKFDITIDNKQLLLEKIDEMEQVFQLNYEKVKEDIVIQKSLYAGAIQEMQSLIRQMTELSLKIRSAEIQNKQSAEIVFSNTRKKVKEYHISNRTASQYYKNMANQHIGQSYFVDKKN